MNIIEKYLANRKKEREEYQKKLDYYTELFRCGEALWKKIEDLEDHKVYVEKYYNGNHKTHGFQMTLKLEDWRGFLFELHSVRPRNYFNRVKVLEEVADRLAEKWHDESIKYNIWEPIWYKDGIQVTGLDNVVGLTGVMLKDFDNLAPKTTEADANKFAKKVIAAAHNLDPKKMP